MNSYSYMSKSRLGSQCSFINIKKSSNASSGIKSSLASPSYLHKFQNKVKFFPDIEKQPSNSFIHKPNNVMRRGSTENFKLANNIKGIKV